MKLLQVTGLFSAPAVPSPAREAAALEEDSGVCAAIPMMPSVEAEQTPMPVVPSEVVPYADFLEHRRRRHGAASELAPQDADARGE
jgi:hypothetical protein